MDDVGSKLPKTLSVNSSNTFRAPSKLQDSPADDSLKNRRRSDHAPGNRVAVRKYREKKKAQNAYLEEEVKKLRVVNRLLIRKLQVQAALEAEAVRLRRLLMDLKGEIGDGLRVSRFDKQSCNGGSSGCIRRE